jgi:XRE family transcriptional regulator, regulator of sulfur utilization
MRHAITKVTIGERFGHRIRKLREDREMTQLDLCESIGWGQAYLSRLENGRIDVCLKSIQALANAFELSISELMRGI